MNIDKAFWENLAKGRISAKSAVAALIDAGHAESEARDLVFVAVGGSDLIETGPDNVQRYPSGKSVEEVERIMQN